MCRFSSRNDPGYEQVVGELRILVEQLHQETMTLTVSLNQNEESQLHNFISTHAP